MRQFIIITLLNLQTKKLRPMIRTQATSYCTTHTHAISQAKPEVRRLHPSAPRLHTKTTFQHTNVDPYIPRLHPMAHIQGRCLRTHAGSLHTHADHRMFLSPLLVSFLWWHFAKRRGAPVATNYLAISPTTAVLQNPITPTAELDTPGFVFLALQPRLRPLLCTACCIFLAQCLGPETLAVSPWPGLPGAAHYGESV